MNVRTPLIRAALAATMVAGSFAIERVPHAAAADAGMSVEARAPLHATLLPALRVTARAANPDDSVASELAAGEALPVTLLPTVRVTASAADFAMLVAPFERVLAGDADGVLLAAE
ncbi:hypothetical protein [Dokdonella sp.]|uniref:hypothetical protein n=1 Tax=Dokdonella sp. TaxID=2291710 RepID=UPI002F3F0E73